MDNVIRRGRRVAAELEPRVEAYVEKLSAHFDDKVAANGWKGMVVTPSREAAALYGELLEDRRGPGEVEPGAWRDWRDVNAHTEDKKYEAFAAAMIGEGVFFPPKVGRINLMHAHEDEHIEQALEAAKIAIEAVPG